MWAEKEWATVEHAFQAMKTSNEGEIEGIRLAKNPEQAKKMGRRVKLRLDWEQVKVGIMEDIVMAKFQQHPSLARKLVATGDTILKEGNSWGDAIWGVDHRTGRGRNLMGRILMEIREELADLVE